MNQLWQYGCALSIDDRQILTQIDEMNNQWDAYTFFDVLKAYRDFDFLLKRSFLNLLRQMPSEKAYVILHEIWIRATKDMHSFFDNSNLFKSSNDSVRLKDLIELSFFHAKQITNLSDSSSATTPVITVVMPVYRSQQYLWEALRSIYEQSYQEFELILVNQYQNDDPLDQIVSAFGDMRTIIVQNTVRSCLATSLNIGIKQAKGEYIARMDSDDIALSERFSKQIEFFRTRPEIDFCGTQYRAFGTTNNWNNPTYPLQHEEIQCRSLKLISFLHPSVMWRKEKFIEKKIKYNEDVLAEDTDLFARVVYSLKTANLPETLLLYRREGQNLSYENLKKKDANNQSLIVLESNRLEKETLQALYKTLTLDELSILKDKELDSFTYGDALQVFKYRLGREDLSDLLPRDTSRSEKIFSTNLNNRIPVIWGYGWNGQMLEYSLHEQGYPHYRIVDQRLQELGATIDSSRVMKIEELDGKSSDYYIIISMDKHFSEVTDKLGGYGYTPQRDYVEFFI